MSISSTMRLRKVIRDSDQWFPVRRCFGTSSRKAEAAKPSTVLPTADDSAESNAVGLKPLNRPLGVRERPTIFQKTTAEAITSYLDPNFVKEQRKHLLKEANKGYFHDMNNTRRHGGKTWIAPKVLIKEDKALYLPDIAGKCLDGGLKKHTTTMCFGRITLLCMLGTKISEIHTKGFSDSTHARFSSNPLYQYVQINLQENLLKSMLVNLFTNSLRSVVPTELHPTYLVSSQNMEYVRDPMGMTNSKVGYVYLIDENLKIRWGGCADATAEEARALEICTSVLLDRLEKKPKATVKVKDLSSRIPGQK